MASKVIPVFGSENQPLRASLLPVLFNCSRSFYKATLMDGQGESNEYADTGSMVHMGIQVFHESRGNEIAALAAIEKSIEIYKYGIITDAITHFKNYAKREKAEKRGEVIELEKVIQIKLKAAEFDKTKKEIVINGHVDQIRKLGDWLYVIDHKTGYKDGLVMVREHTPQLAAYHIGVCDMYKTKKVKTFIARTRDLISSRNPFLWQMPFDYTRAIKIMDTVRHKVALIRMGIFDSTPGKHCDFCRDERFYPDCVDGQGQIRPPKTESQTKRGVIHLTQAVQHKTVAELFGQK